MVEAQVELLAGLIRPLDSVIEAALKGEGTCSGLQHKGS